MIGLQVRRVPGARAEDAPDDAESALRHPGV